LKSEDRGGHNLQAIQRSSNTSDKFVVSIVGRFCMQ